MSDGNIGSNAGFSRKRQAHHIGRDVIKAVGFSIESKQRRFLQLLNPADQRSFIEDGDIVFGRQRGCGLFDFSLNVYVSGFAGRFSGRFRPFSLHPGAGLNVGYPALKFVFLEQR